MEPCSAYSEGEREADSPALKAHYDLNGGNKKRRRALRCLGLVVFSTARLSGLLLNSVIAQT